MSDDNLPAFVPVSAEPDSPGPSAEADRLGGAITISLGDDLMLRVPGDVPAARTAAMVGVTNCRASRRYELCRNLGDAG